MFLDLMNVFKHGEPEYCFALAPVITRLSEFVWLAVFLHDIYA